MRALGWMVIVLGALGVAACGYSLYMTHTVRDDLSRSTRAVAGKARGLLDTVDKNLKALPAQLNELRETDRPRPVLDKVRHLEEILASASETMTAVLTLLEAATSLRQGASTDIEQEFPRLASIATTLADLVERFRAQIQNTETWTLRFVVLSKAMDTLRDDVGETRDRTEKLESSAIDTLDTLWLYAVLFLIWMAAGQVGLIVLGRRRAAAGPPAVD
jgi:hypothetical protein